MYTDKEKECSQLVLKLLAAGKNLAEACKDNERAALIRKRLDYVARTSRLLDELIHTLQCKNQVKA